MSKDSNKKYEQNNSFSWFASEPDEIYKLASNFTEYLDQITTNEELVHIKDHKVLLPVEKK